MAPILSRHRSETYLNDALFKRIDALKAAEQRLGLSSEQARVLARYHLDFTRACQPQFLVPAKLKGLAAHHAS